MASVVVRSTVVVLLFLIHCLLLLPLFVGACFGMQYLESVLVLQPGPEVIILYSCSTRLSTKFILLINIKIPGGGGGGGGTLIFSHIRRLGPFLGVQNSEFQYFLGVFRKMNIF